MGSFRTGCVAAVAMITSFLAVPRTASAITEGFNFNAYLRETAAVVEGTVVGDTVYYDDQVGPRTITEFANVQVHFGSPRIGRTLRINVFGGPVPQGGITGASHMPTFIGGKRYVMFLQRGDWFWSPIVADATFRSEHVRGRDLAIANYGSVIVGLGDMGPVVGAEIFYRPGLYVGPLQLSPFLTSRDLRGAMTPAELIDAVGAFIRSHGVSPNGTFTDSPAITRDHWNAIPVTPFDASRIPPALVAEDERRVACFPATGSKHLRDGNPPRTNRCLCEAPPGDDEHHRRARHEHDEGDDEGEFSHDSDDNDDLVCRPGNTR